MHNWITLLHSKLFFLFIGVQLLYHVVLFSAVQQSESATGTNIHPLFFGFPYLSGNHAVLSRVRMLYSRFSQLSILYIAVCMCVYICIYVMYIYAYMFICQSQFPNSSDLSCVHMFVLYVCVSVSSLQIDSSEPLSRFHMYTLIYNICFSDLPHSVQQYGSLQVHPPLYKWHNFIPFYGRLILHCGLP